MAKRLEQIRYVKLVNGEDIVAKVVAGSLTATAIRFKDICKVLYIRDPSGDIFPRLAPFAAGVTVSDCTINNSAIVTTMPVSEGLANHYHSFITYQKGLDAFMSQTDSQKKEAMDAIDEIPGSGSRSRFH